MSAPEIVTFHASRYVTGVQTTVARVTLGHELICRFLEDEDRPDGSKIYGRTCIPTGLYRIDPVHETDMAQRYYERWDWFRGLPALTWIDHRPMVPSFGDLRIHPGNTHIHTLGCPLTASAVELIEGDYEARASVPAFRALCLRLYAAWDEVRDTHLRINDRELRRAA